MVVGRVGVAVAARDGGSGGGDGNGGGGGTAIYTDLQSFAIHNLQRFTAIYSDLHQM